MEVKKSNQGGSTLILMDVDKLTEVLHQLLDEKFPKVVPFIAPIKDAGPLDEYIPKSAVRGKLLASSTLWKHERKGNLKTYAIGGKRYYKRIEIQNLIQEVKR